MSREDKVASMRDAVAELVRDGDTLAIEGFTHLISFAAGHEVIRQRRRDLTLCRLTPDVVYDQMIGAGVARKLVFSWMGNPGVGSLHAIRRRVEHHDPAPLELEEYSHFGMVGRYAAGAANLPFWPLRSYFETDLPAVNPNIRPVASPFGGEPVFAVPPLHPDVAVVHAQRADAAGNTQMWGLTGCQKEAAFAASRVIVVVEELVASEVVRADPNRTLIPGIKVDAVVVCPRGAHPSYAQGYYDRDNRFYLDWDRISRDPEALSAWLDEWVHGTRPPRRVRGEAGRRAVGQPDPGPGHVGVGRLRGLPLMAPWSKCEMLVVAGARALAGRRVCFVGIGLPNIAVALAQRTVAPGIELIYESGVYGARPARLPLSIGDPCLVTGATAAMSMVELFSHYLQGGLVDVGFLGAAQLDRFGNINTTVIGDYQRPKVRLPGSGGACEIAINAREVFVLMRQSARSFVERIDFRTSPGNLGGAALRAAQGWQGRGPSVVVTDLGRYGFDPDTGEMVLAAVHPGVEVSDARAATGWDLRVADDLEVTPDPTDEELALIREELDPDGVYVKG